MISLISDEVATYQVHAAPWKTDEGHELLVQSVWNGLEGENTLSQDDATTVDAEDGVHVSGNVELLKGLHASLGPVLHVLLGLLELLRQLDTRVCENNSLEVDELTFLQFDIDDWTSISNDDDLGILVSLLNGETWLRDWLVARIDSLCEPNDAVLLSEVQSHFQLVNRTLFLVDLDDTGVLEVTKHLVVNVLRRPVEVAKLTLHDQIVDILVNALKRR
jgi:hypothetical protein